MNADNPARPVNAVKRAAAILRLLGAAERPLTVTEIATDLGLVPSTVLHILRTLAHEGLAAAEPGSKRYRLGPGTVELARAYLGSPPLARQFQPHLDQFAREHGVTALGIEWDGGPDLTVTAIACATTNFSVHANLGSRFPALTSATGRCFAAHGDWSEAALERAFADLEWQDTPDFSTWMEEVRAVNRNGFAEDDGNYLAGVTVLAVPVLDGTGTAIGAVAVLALSGRLSTQGREPLIDDLKAAGRALSEASKAHAVRVDTSAH
jgi:DNA-binding IclR family transcriptional regulator